mmetsp:Transcript_49600/g.44411  ORF Transcript_49600/g.44411 Transcript_49600/m.44411 type:complete len:550 (-) Transcript_49600:145-1794(-)
MFKLKEMKRNKEYRRIKQNILTNGFIILLFISLIIISIQYMQTNSNNHHTNTRHLLQTPSTTKTYEIEGADYPPDAFTKEQLQSGAFILHIIGLFYMFLAIAIVCDEFFVPAIEEIVEALNLAPDVAGATFMAAGGSAPELFTSFFGTFVSKSSVGFGTIVGSAVFNVLFIIGACAIFTSGKLKLQWWPFARDMSYYIICLGALSLFFGGISKNQMFWWESLILLAMYFLYVFIMTQNAKLRAWVYRKFVDGEDKQTLLKDQSNGYGTEREISMQKATTFNKGKSYDAETPRPDAVEEEDEFCDGDGGSHSLQANATNTNGHHKVEDDSDDEDGNDSDDESEEGLDMTFPDGCLARCWYIFKMPLTYPIYYTMFDVSKEEYEDWWPWTFFGSLMWLGGLSYLMVWWAVVVGYAWKVPQEIMGLVFLAAGTSVPELFACIIVAKKGQADMAVSASIGSNIFDVLVGLPLPWLSYSIIFGEESGDLRIDVEAHGLFLSILVLILMLTGMLAIILFNKWILTHCMGYSMILLYVLFVAQDLIRYYTPLDIEF